MAIGINQIQNRSNKIKSIESRTSRLATKRDDIKTEIANVFFVDILDINKNLDHATNGEEVLSDLRNTLDQLSYSDM
jgi:hypothetical protein